MSASPASGRLPDLDPGQAAALLAATGVPVHNLAHGMGAWARAGLPVVTDDGRPGEIA